MKKLSAYFFLLAMINCCAVTSRAQTSIQLTTLGKEGKKNNIDVFVGADTLQQQPETGLTFTLTLRNNADSIVTIFNPAEMLRPRLLNETGVDIIYPHFPRGFICSKIPYDYFYTSFDIEKITVNDTVTDIDLPEKTYLTIAPKAVYKLFLKIRKVLPPDAVKPYQYGATVKIPDGKYQFSLNLGVHMNNKMDFYRMKPVVINYRTLTSSPLVIIRNEKR